jgi:acyl-CoA reductase-like NAD-dependent aldehyde dehydrogenase
MRQKDGKAGANLEVIESTRESREAPRLAVRKTYKIYIDGQFPRTESGRAYPAKDADGNTVAQVCWCSRKDARNAVVAARKAFAGWSARTAFNRSQILYRIAEVLEGRSEQLIAELCLQGANRKKAQREVEACCDRLVYYAGWCDKYQQIFGSVNPVSARYFNFTQLEPVGVVAAACPEEPSLLGMVSVMAPVICSGNTMVLLASERLPLAPVTFSEVLQTSDLPAGVVNILTGPHKEMLPVLAGHMDVNSVLSTANDPEIASSVQSLGAENIKRCIAWDVADYYDPAYETPYRINEFLEAKSTWHPVGL